MNANLPPSSPSLGQKNICVLLVDDDTFVCKIMADMLKSIGVLQIISAASGKEALNTLMTCKPEPHLIFCDLHMPGQDGFQLMAELANRQYQGGVVIVSGQQNHVLNSGSIMARFHQLNFIVALEKPVTRQQMVDILKKV